MQSKIAAKTYWLLTALFGCFYGLYGYYAFVYLDAVRPGSPRIFEGLLFVLAATMVFEVIVEPVTGRYADLFGRRQAVAIAFVLCTIAFLLYAAISLSYVSSSLWTVITIAIFAELVIAFGLAFHSGSLDSWVVEQIYHSEKTRNVGTEPVFAIASITFAVGLTLGGMTGAFAVPKSGEGAALWPWFLSAFLAIVTILVAAITLHDHRPIEERVAAQPSSAFAVIVESFAKVLQLRRASREIWVGILVTSINYIIGIIFIYFSLLVAKYLLFNRADPAWLSAAPLLLLIPRLIGPWLCIRVTAGASPHQDAKYRKLMTSIGMALGACSLALGASVWELSTNVSTADRDTSTTLLSIAIGAAFLTSMLHHMLKPIASSYLNHYIEDDSERAFTNSMATPLGAMVVALLAATLLIWNQGSPIPRGQDLGLIFIAPGLLVMAASAVIAFRGK